MRGQRNAWVTVVYDDESCLHALVLAKSLRRVVTTADIVVLALKNLPDSIKIILNEVFDVLVHFTSSQQERNPSCATVLDDGMISSWGLTMYTKCVLLHHSILAVKNCDDLFTNDEKILFLRSSNSTDHETQLMVIKPSYHTYLKIVSFLTGQEKKLTGGLNLNEIIKEALQGTEIQILKSDILVIVDSFQQITTLNKASTKLWCFQNNKPWQTTNMNDQIDTVNSVWMNIFVEEIIPYISNEEIKTLNATTFAKPDKSKKGMKTTISKTLHNEIKDSIAIIGQSCRLPGANSVEEFWELLESGGDGITSIPLERLQEHQSSDPRFTSIKAGFLKCPIDEFDAKFFGISPREAAYMDPQQRLMVEVAWEALEDAALNPATLKGSNTGVFSGVWTHEYERLLNESTTGRDFHHVVLGNAFSATSARVSYFLGLNGPNVATESGCSSSMVALHLACDSLRKRETDLALATGVNLLIDHFPHSEVSILAKDGHCKTFDEKADGFARAEGVVVVVLKRLSDAVRDGNRILSIVRGSALSNEGTTTSFGTPSKYCQEIAIKDALKVAGVKPEEVDYVEAHGTGTPIGDPIEFAAISAGYKAQREKPLIIGSVKTNTGHTESAAGLAGLLKVNLAMQNQCIPPHRNLNSVNPNIDLNALPAHIPLLPITWNRNPQRKRLAAVSSFGISGTNVHVILQEPPIIPSLDFQSVNQDRTHHLLTLSAKTENALKDLTQNYVRHLNNHPELALENICHTANIGRQHLKHRIALVSNNSDDLKQKLNNTVIVPETLTNGKSKTVFLFTGQGSQYSSMGKTLYETNPIFQNALNECDYIIKNKVGISINEVLFVNGEDKDAKLKETIYSQTSIFCIEYGLLKLWESFGIKPNYVLGHSVGEFAASVAAGVMTLEEALTLLTKRSDLIQSLPAGGMLAVRTNKEIVQNLIESFCLNNSGDWLDIAVVNSLEEVVVASKQSVLKKFSEFCRDHNIKSQHLAASHAFHSRDMEAMLNEFGKTADNINFKPSICKYVSGSTGKHLNGGDMDSKYWQNHARHTVDFSKGIKLVHEEGCNIFIEIGAHPILLAIGMSNLPPLETQNCLWLPSVRRNEDNWMTLLSSVSKLYVNGADIDWHGFDSCYNRTTVNLPHYPFQRQKYWIESKLEPVTKPLHPLLGRKIPLAVVKDHVFQNDLNMNDFLYLLDHQVANVVVFPGAGFLEIILSAGKEVWKDDSNNSHIVVEDLTVEAPLELEEEKLHKIQVVAAELENSNSLLIQVFVYKNVNGYNDEKGWQKFASARVFPNKSEEIHDSLQQGKSRCLEEVSSEEFYKNTLQLGIKFGTTFRSITKFWKGTNEIIAEISSPRKAGNIKEYIYHPIVLDAMIQAAGLSAGESNSDLYLPVGIKKFSMFRALDSDILFAHAFKDDSVLYVRLFDKNSNLLCTMNGVRLMKTSIGSFMNAICAQKNKLPGLLQEIWRPRYSHLHARVDVSLLPNIEIITERVNERMKERNDSCDILDDINIVCERFICISIWNAFHELGWRPKLGDRILLRMFMSDYLLTPTQIMFIERLFTILEEDGFLERDLANEVCDWVVTRLPDSFEDLRGQLNQLTIELDSFGDYAPERHILFHCDQKLKDLLLGKISGVEVLFGDANINALIFYTKGISVTIANNIARYAIESKFERIKENGSILRILEIGAGSGATTKAILAGLQSKEIQFRYTFTDISPSFLNEAKRSFANISSIEYKVLNIENDPKHQGFVPHSYDVIVAANVIHATENIADCVRNVRQLLTSSGTLILQEMLKPVRLIDFVYGTVEGYWKFKDFDLRAKHPCIDKQAWNRVLGQHGFKYTHLLSGVHERTSILVAEATDTNPVYIPVKHLNNSKKISVWLIFSGLDVSISNSLKKMIENSGDKAIVIVDHSIDTDIPEVDLSLDYLDEKSISTFLSGMHESFVVQGIVVLLSLCNSNFQEQFCRTSLYITKYLASSNSVCKIIEVNRGVYYIGDQGNMSPSQATICGVLKSFQTERPDFDCTLIDLDPDNLDPQKETEQIFAELWYKDEHSVSYRKNKRNVIKLVNLQTVSSPLELPNGRYEIVIPKNKKVNDITYKSPKSYLLQPDEVEICVKASALNFRDVFTILKPDTFSSKFEAVGTDFGGIVSKVGGSVSKYKIGDEVFGISNNSSIASHVIVNSNLMVRKPKEFTFAEACTLPSVFLTAYHCLVPVAKLKAGETILIHVASGGVGLVAIQLAQSLGAQIIATAGNKRKRAYLKSLGINNVFHSRDLSFGENIDKVTNGKGVDMVLNSLTGLGFKETSLKACTTNARFIEMGKVNIWQHEDVSKLRPDVKYTIVNLETVEALEMDTLIKAMHKVVTNQQIKPIPYTRFFASQIKDALNYFMKAQHIGKIVVIMPEIKESLGKQFKSDLLFNNNGTYLVTGGLGGIGLEVAKWMVKCGARHVVLIGRSAPNEKTQQVLKSLSCKGVQVLARQVDVGDLKQCENLFVTIKNEMPPLRGVIHSAGALSDGMIRNQTWEKFDTVFNAKVKGGWNLHHLTKDMSLEHFVLFSSMAALVGPLGQSNHCAANMFLDSLSFYRHSLGLPAQTINWGAWSEVGAATNTTFGKEGALGVKPFSPSQGIAALQHAMSQPIVQVGIVHLNFNEFCKSYPVALGYCSEVLEGQGEETSINDQGEKFWNDVESHNEEYRTAYIKKCIESIIRQTLKLPESEVLDEHQTFSEMGLDSLMAVELRNKLQQLFGKQLTLNPTSLLDYPTLSGLSKYLANLTMFVDSNPSITLKTETDVKQVRDLSSLDSILPSNIQTSGKPACPSDIKSIFITGVTGHLGPYILKELVEKSNIQITCLIRAKNLQFAEKKLKDNLKKFSISISLTNINIVLGDITKPDLGMSTTEYEKVARHADAVFHCAVKANHIEKYIASKSGKDIRSVNVLGTIKVLEFAAAFKTKRVAFVSSYVAANVLNEEGYIPDEFPSEENKGEGLEIGYPLTKFVCEKLIDQAIKRGIPCTVFRLPTLMGHSETGHFTADTNFIMNFVITCARRKVFVDIPGGWNSIPVDIASKISVEILFRDQAETGLYNMVISEPMTSDWYMKIAKEMGMFVQIVNDQEFLEILENESNPLLDIFKEASEGRNFIETIKGTSPVFKSALEGGKQIFNLSPKLTNALSNYKKIIPSVVEVMRLQMKYAITSGIFDQMGVAYGGAT